MYLDALRRLRGFDLFRKGDIRQYNLLRWSCHPSVKEIFEYLVDWDQKALKEHHEGNNPLFHVIISSSGSSMTDSFTLMLKAGLKHYPEELGFLFLKNDVGETAFDRACTEYGKARL